MSAYEDGKSFLAGYLAGLDQYLMVVSSGRFVLPHEVTAESLLNDLLAALPPSIVVDGKVVELVKVVDIISDVYGDRITTYPALLAAAREVADAPSS